MENQSKKPDQFLQTDQLNFLLRKVKELSTISEHFLPLLEENIRKECQIANIVNKQLIILASNASVATWLRFNKSRLLAQFNRDPILKPYSDFHCIVRLQPPNLLRNQIKEKKQMTLLSVEAAKAMMEAASDIHDERLKEVMLRIASHTKK